MRLIGGQSFGRPEIAEAGEFFDLVRALFRSGAALAHSERAGRSCGPPATVVAPVAARAGLRCALRIVVGAVDHVVVHVPVQRGPFADGAQLTAEAVHGGR